MGLQQAFCRASQTGYPWNHERVWRVYSPAENEFETQGKETPSKKSRGPAAAGEPLLVD
jgi:hypothetical protein